MLIDFNSITTMTIPGMNAGTGEMTCRMYNDDAYRIIPTTIHPGGSIGSHKQESGDDLNYILSGSGKAVCDGVEEELKAGVMHVCHMWEGAGKIAFGVYACSPEDSSFTAVFTDFEVGECMWKAHDGQKPDET